jgi:hypothetical protein
MSILARRAHRAQQPPSHAALETLAKKTTDILEELADHWDFSPLKGDEDSTADRMKRRIKTAIRAARQIGL